MPGIFARTGGAWSAQVAPGKLSVYPSGGAGWIGVRKAHVYSGGAWRQVYDALSGGIIIVPTGAIVVSGGTAVLTVTNRLTGYRLVGTAVAYESGAPVNTVAVDQASDVVSLPLVSFFANQAVFTLRFVDPSVPVSGPDATIEAFF